MVERDRGMNSNIIIHYFKLWSLHGNIRIGKVGQRIFPVGKLSFKRIA